MSKTAECGVYGQKVERKYGKQIEDSGEEEARAGEHSASRGDTSDSSDRENETDSLDYCGRNEHRVCVDIWR
jgi:hypothetical protein